MKKIFKIVAIGMICASISGCSSGKTVDLNEDRPNNYQFDFAHFVTADIYGTNGDGKISVDKKDVLVSDFASEDDYIAFDKVFSSLVINVTPSAELKNGDIVEIAPIINSSNSDQMVLNLNPFKYMITDLPESQEMSLFVEGRDFNMYGFENRPDILIEKLDGGMVVKELFDEMVYSARTNVGGSVANKTVATVSCIANGEDIQEAARRYGYALTEAEKEVVIKSVAKPLDEYVINESKRDIEILKFINEKIARKELDGNTHAMPEAVGFGALKNAIMINQVKMQSASNPYNYRVKLEGADVNGQTVCFDVTISIADFDGEIGVFKLDGLSERYNLSAYKSCEEQLKTIEKDNGQGE